MARPREFDEQAVVGAAMDVFWRQGYRATSVDDLVEATGLQRGSLYGAFGDKHGVLMQALDAYGRMPLDRLEALVADADDPVDGLRAFIRAAGADCKDRTMASRGCLVGNTCNELAAHDEAARETLEGFLTRLRQVMADALRQGQAFGTFDADRNPEAAATFIQCSLQGLALLAKTRPAPAAVDAVVDELLGVIDCPANDHPPTPTARRAPADPEKGDRR